MRLDKFLAQHLSISRKQVSRELRAGRVTVDGQVIKTGAVALTPEQAVYYNGVRVRAITGSRYFMLHKPIGYVCAHADPVHPPVNVLLDEPAAEKLHAAGRLDVDTTGLVLLTDDGQWSHRLTSPRHRCAKTYLVTLAEPVTEAMIDALRAGILLRNERVPTLPADAEPLSAITVRLTLHEGRYHQVKRMFAALGNRVVALHRERIGALTLDADLAPGDYRPLTEAEVAAAVQK